MTYYMFDGIDLYYATKGILGGLKRNMSRGNCRSDELELTSVLGDTRAYLYSPVWGYVAIQSRKVTRVKRSVLSIYISCTISHICTLGSG